jgi:hypothetical protein
MVLPALASDLPPVIVGRVTDVEADLLRYVPEENDWVAVVRDVPFAAGDTFYTGNQGRAELMAPNGTRTTLGSATQVQFLALDAGLLETDVAAGLARFYNNGTDTVVKAGSPFGYVLSYPGSVFDFYVGENSVEVVAIRGTVSFVHAGTDSRYDVAAGSPSVLADATRVASGEGAPDPDWDIWNTSRDRFWSARTRPTGPSARYLPPVLWNDAYVLDENGRWVRLFYEGREYWFWKPLRVDTGWAPFTTGRWTEWLGDQTWIPAEPFGYVTHHYGNWVLIDGQWYWAPPVVKPGPLLLSVQLVWYPGRVSWIHHDGYVGWVPLAPRETYYCHHRWGGPHAVVFDRMSGGRTSFDARRFAYADRAVVVPQNRFYGTVDYRKVRVTNVTTTTIINSYRAAPVIDNSVIKNYPSMRQRFDYAAVAAKEKPHASVTSRVQRSERSFQTDRKESSASIEQQARSARPGNVSRDARVQPPKMTSYIVPASEASRPKSEVTFQERDVRTAGQRGTGIGTQGQPEQGRRVGPASPGTHLTDQAQGPGRQPRLPEAGPETRRDVESPGSRTVAPPRPAQQAAPGTTVEQPFSPRSQIPRQPEQVQRPQAQPRTPEASPEVRREMQPQPRPQAMTPPRQVPAGGPASVEQPAASRPQAVRPAEQVQRPQAQPRQPEVSPGARREMPQPKPQAVVAPRPVPAPQAPEQQVQKPVPPAAPRVKQENDDKKPQKEREKPKEENQR